MGGVNPEEIGLDVLSFGSYSLAKRVLLPEAAKELGMTAPSAPKVQNPALPPRPQDAADQAVQNARIMERRRQLGLQGRMSTFLTTAQSDTSGGNTYLGQ